MQAPENPAPETEVPTKQLFIKKEPAFTVEFDGAIQGEGVLEMMPDGYGFLRSSDYNYYLSFPSMNHNDGGKLYRGDIDREGKKFTDYPESTIYMHSVGTPEAPNYIGAISNRRSSQMASLDSMVLNMLIPGDGIIYPGSKIKFSYKSFEFTTRANNEINDTFYDGDYLVTGIKHQFISEKYRMTLSCSKESLKINVEDYARSI